MPTTLVIPTTNEPRHSLRTRLDGREFELRLAWNQSDERWALALYDELGALLVAGIRLVANRELLRFSHHDPRVPPGALVVVDQTTDGSPPGLDELGPDQRCMLVYHSTTDL